MPRRVRITITVDTYVDRLPFQAELDDLASDAARSASRKFGMPTPLSKEASYEEVKETPR